MPNYQGVWSLSTQFQAQGEGNWPENYVAPIAVNLQGETSSSAYTQLNLTTQGNATSFGSAGSQRNQFAALSSATRGLFGGGEGAGSTAPTYSIEYITIASAGNGTDFGNLSQSLVVQLSGSANSTRGIWWHGAIQPYYTARNVIEYSTISSLGNVVDFGDNTADCRGNGSAANSTRSLCALGFSGGVVNTVTYITIASTSNASDFGDLTTSDRYKTAGFSSSTQAFFAAGGGSTGSGVNIVDYFTFLSTGNATDWGDLLNGYNAPAATSSSVYGFILGGFGSGVGTVNTIQNISLSSSGNSSDWGDLTAAMSENEAVSSVHGGLS